MAASTKPTGARTPLKIAIVGPCSAGKSTLLPTLTAAGYEARQPAQEHSFAPDMWRRLTNPDLLIYLDVSYPVSKSRRPGIDGGPGRLARQAARLRHARLYCDLYLETNDLTPEQVSRSVLDFLDEWQSTRGI